MILVLLGTQDAPFPRIIDLSIEAVGTLGVTSEIVVQAGHTSYQSQLPHVKIVDFLTPTEFETLISTATVVVCHGGAGTMVTALKHNKPVIALARTLAHGEHNNDHQRELVEKFAQLGYVQAVQTQAQMQVALARITNGDWQQPDFALKNQLTRAVETYIDELVI